MVCPNCESIATRIIPNTDFYTCCDCHHTFGYVVGSRTHCPECNSTDITAVDDYQLCNSCGCKFKSTTDSDVEFPPNVIFSSRDITEFFRRSIVS